MYRLIAALNWLVDSLPASNLDNPEIITFDTYGIIIYSSVTPSSFSGHTVAALLGESFQFTDFTTDDIIVGGSGYSETPTAEIQTTSSLFSGLNVTAPAKVIYNVFLNDTLFTRRQTQPNVTSIVVAARIAGLGASNLASPVQTVFLKNMTVRFSKHNLVEFEIIVVIIMCNIFFGRMVKVRRHSVCSGTNSLMEVMVPGQLRDALLSEIHETKQHVNAIVCHHMQLLQMLQVARLVVTKLLVHTLLLALLCSLCVHSWCLSATLYPGM